MTPETDAKESPHIGFYSCATVPAEFARKLERERDEWAALCGQYKAERDEARAELEMWRDGNILHEIHRDELEEAKHNAGIRVTDKIPNENNHPNYGGTSLL